MVDTNFLVSFNDVIQENFVSVVKQNLLFQAQIKILEEQIKIIPEYEEKIKALELTKDEVKGLLHENNDLKNELNQKNEYIENAAKEDTDRHRLQSAVNAQAKEISDLKETIESLTNKNKKNVDTLNSELKKQKEYVVQLEEMIPNSKRKKLGLPLVEEKVKEDAPLETKNNDKKLELVASGGSF